MNIPNHAGDMHLAVTPALADFLPQIRQPNVSAEPLNQILFSILPGTSARSRNRAA